MAYDDDQGIAAFLDDLEQQAQGAWATGRGHEVAERARAEYARVALAGRLMAGLGDRVGLQVAGIGGLAGELVRVAEGWILLADANVEWIVLLEAVETVRGLPVRSVPPETWPVTARLGVRSGLRAMAGERCLVRLRSGGQVDGRLGRVGADFLEVHPEEGAAVLVALRAVAAVRR